MIDKRPVNLDIGTIRLPISALVSILHRVSGVALIGAIAILLGLLDYSLRSADSFAAVISLLASVPMKLLMLAVLAAFIYHLVAGIRHLVMEFGIGESLEGGRKGAVLVIAFTAIGVVLAGVWLW
ncbi:MAG TPA: succinate dehydrogenase, cytochrome b556 subunit [Pseudomonadales bacterium]|nr:succinate dehydrogenase, cytochrome b556 subunit [Pseudomonadales bacterium]HNL92164.1 succinate dehydrogenase, cytochrome b556 subunit [Pseudomonadales bacterium]HNN86544.1 succinate dehydrogenase, cytochrome b556 subunit [Pseudomonadales bacterium]